MSQILSANATGIQTRDAFMPWGETFAMEITGDPICIGDGEPCPMQSTVGPGMMQCLQCSDIEMPDCIFEPRCKNDPSHCACDFGVLPHVVYCAMYGTLQKVGMTQAWRVSRRLQEQGADAFFVISRQDNRALARQAERTISTLYKFPEYRTHKEVLPQLARPVAWDAIEARIEHWHQQLRQRYPVEDWCAVLHPDSPQPLGQVPRKVQPVGTHAGRVVGRKGPYLYYAEAPRPDRLDFGDPPIAALNLGSLTGRVFAQL